MKSPLWVVGKVLYFAWWPFGYLLSLLVGALTPWVLSSEKRWSWIIAKFQSMGATTESIEAMQAARRTYLSGGATVILPEQPTVEHSQTDQAATHDEAKP